MHVSSVCLFLSFFVGHVTRKYAQMTCWKQSGFMGYASNTMLKMGCIYLQCIYLSRYTVHKTTLYVLLLLFGDVVSCIVICSVSLSTQYKYCPGCLIIHLPEIYTVNKQFSLEIGIYGFLMNALMGLSKHKSLIKRNSERKHWIFYIPQIIMKVWPCSHKRKVIWKAAIEIEDQIHFFIFYEKKEICFEFNQFLFWNMTFSFMSSGSFFIRRSFIKWIFFLTKVLFRYVQNSAQF